MCNTYRVWPVLGRSWSSWASRGRRTPGVSCKDQDSLLPLSCCLAVGILLLWKSHLFRCSAEHFMKAPVWTAAEHFVPQGPQGMLGLPGEPGEFGQRVRISFWWKTFLLHISSSLQTLYCTKRCSTEYIVVKYPAHV